MRGVPRPCRDDASTTSSPTRSTIRATGSTFRCRAGAKPDGGATVVVRDRGIGIPAEKLPRIFDDYFRTNEAVAHNKASTGLGLAIVRQAALAGQIGVHVESAPAQGTVFSLDFPALRTSPETAGLTRRNERMAIHSDCG